MIDEVRWVVLNADGRVTGVHTTQASARRHAQVLFEDETSSSAIPAVTTNGHISPDREEWSFEMPVKPIVVIERWHPSDEDVKDGSQEVDDDD
jgi:hypothetical protein